MKWLDGITDSMDLMVSAGKSRQEAVAAIREERAAWTSAGMSRSCPWRSSSPGRMWRRVGTSLVLSRTGCRPLWLEPGDQGGRVGGAVGVRILSKLGSEEGSHYLTIHNNLQPPLPLSSQLRHTSHNPP